MCVDLVFIGFVGFEDILYGYPLMEQHMERNYELTKNLAEYHVMVANNESVDVLFKTEPPRDKKWWLSELLHILSGVWVLCVPNNGWNVFFHIFLQDFDAKMKKIYKNHTILAYFLM